MLSRHFLHENKIPEDIDRFRAFVWVPLGAGLKNTGKLGKPEFRKKRNWFWLLVGHAYTFRTTPTTARSWESLSSGKNEISKTF
jgi:hypothetical protein